MSQERKRGTRRPQGETTVPLPTVGIHRASAWLAIAVVVLAPLPLGSDEPVWVALWCALMAISLLFADLEGVGSRQTRPAAAAILVLAAICAVVALQMMPPLPTLPAADGWAAAARLLGGEIPARPASTAANLFAKLGPAILFVFTFCRFALLAADREAVRTLFQALRWAAVAYALATALLFLVNPRALLWQEKIFYSHTFTGTFINRNTAATFFGTCAVLWLLWAFRQAQSEGFRRPTRLADLVSAERGVPRSVILAAFGFLVCFAATVMTGSRAGFLVSFGMMMLATVVTFSHGRKAPGGGGRWRLWLAALAIAIVLLELFGQRIAARIEQGGLSDQLRLYGFIATIEMIRDQPWLGVGLGNFASAFPPYRPEELGISGIFDRAHNTWLEVAAELGLPVAGLIGAMWLWGASRLVGRLRRHEPGRSVAIAGLCVGLLGTLHSLVDFSLQVPGYAVAFAAIVGAAIGQASSVAHSKERPPAGQR